MSLIASLDQNPMEPTEEQIAHTRELYEKFMDCMTKHQQDGRSPVSCATAMAIATNDMLVCIHGQNKEEAYEYLNKLREVMNETYDESLRQYTEAQGE